MKLMWRKNFIREEKVYIIKNKKLIRFKKQLNKKINN